MKYAEIFQLRIRHDYFLDGTCRDLALSPDAETQSRIDGHRWLLRKLGDRVILLGECTAQGNLLLPPKTDLVFRFQLQPQNSAFFNYTALESPNTGRFQYTNVGAQEIEPGRYRMEKTVEENPTDAAWASLEIVVDANFRTPPQQGNVYDVEFTARQQRWNLFLTTAQEDDNLRIELPKLGFFFQKLELPALLAASADDYLLPDLDLSGTWTGSNESALGLDFTVAPGSITSQGPAPSGNASIWLSTQVLPVDGLVLKCSLDLGFTPNANNQARLFLHADQADLSAPDLNGWFLQVGEAGTGNKLRLFRMTEGTALELAASTSSWTGNLGLDLEIHWHSSGSWEIKAAPLGQTPVSELSVQDEVLLPGQYFGLHGTYTTASRATAFHLDNLEIRVPYGDPNLIGRNRTVAEMLRDQFPDKNQYLFASTGPVAMRQQPHKGLALHNGSVTLIAHLSNPAPADNGTLFFHI